MFDHNKLPFRSKKHEIWQGIVRRAREDGDHSLDSLSEELPVRKFRMAWMAAASIILVLGLSYLFWPNTRNNYVAEREFAAIFSDPDSYSKLVLSNGDTIALEDGEDLTAIAHLQNTENVLDFRQMTGEGLENMRQMVETGRGKQTHFILSDGTAVWLNAASTISFPASFGSDERRVVVRGEVYFEVRRDEQRPFIVETEENRIKVLGTSFNVKHYEGDVDQSVTLLEGAIEIQTAHNNFVLQPSQQYLQVNDVAPEIIQLYDPTTVIAWKNDVFYFKEADAREIVKELERWYPVKVQLKDYNKGKKITGRIRRSDSLQQVAEMLRFFGIEILVEKD